MSNKKLAANLFLHGIPYLDRDEQLAPAEQGEKFALKAKIADLAVNPFILDQAADLAVQHPIKLGNQDDLITKFPVLRKKAAPLRTVLLAPVAGIEKDLAFVDHQKDLSLLDAAPDVLRIILAKGNQALRRQKSIVNIKVRSFWMPDPAEITGEVANDGGIAKLDPMIQPGGKMQGLACSGSAAV